MYIKISQLLFNIYLILDILMLTLLIRIKALNSLSSQIYLSLILYGGRL